MAKLDDLIDQVQDPKLRARLTEAAKEVRERKEFGLVFEEHIPESTVIPSTGVSLGDTVLIRTEPDNTTRYTVESSNGSKATISTESESWVLPVKDLLLVVPFGQPAYSALKRVGDPITRSSTRPFHSVINGENFHVLQLLLFAYRGTIDCIYIDPPYNTGDKSWRYNNDYVDSQDHWSHSKWLSMMEKRLRLAKRLLAPNGVLIVTIDEHEVHHLGMLLEDLFETAYRQMVTIVITARGVAKQGLARVEEHAMYVYEGDAAAVPTPDDFLTESRAGRSKSPWASLLRRGTHALPSDRPGLVYPIFVDPETKAITGAGETLDDLVKSGRLEKRQLDSYVPDRSIKAAWPTRSSGALGTWQVNPKSLLRLRGQGFVQIGRFDEDRQSWSVNYLKRGPIQEIEKGSLVVKGYEWEGGPAILEYSDDGDTGRRAKAVWRRTAHDAGTYGSSLLQDFIGSRSFEFPKSLYAVYDTLSTIVGQNKDAIILDFFAGSGTTLHATAMLNAADDGRRACILVTNNDVTPDDAGSLNAEGFYRGDPEFESRGIFYSVTKPRIEAAMTGIGPSGKPVQGAYLESYFADYDYADGFDENVEFLDMEYLDPDKIAVGSALRSILPALWLTAGAIGDLHKCKPGAHWVLPPGSPFAVLLHEDRLREFRAELDKRPDITHVWLVTDSEAAFARMRRQIRGNRQIGMLYRDYLRNFRINVDPEVHGDVQ